MIAGYHKLFQLQTVRHGAPSLQRYPLGRVSSREPEGLDALSVFSWGFTAARQACPRPDPTWCNFKYQEFCTAVPAFA
jgi:hypothetical protein